MFKVKGKSIGGDSPIFLTAEIGLSHMGRFDDAVDMITAAADAGCDGCDIFMASSNDFYFAPFSPDNDSRKVWDEQSFDDQEWLRLFDLADKLGIIVYVTPLDRVSLQRAARLGTPMINLNSDDISNYPMLEEAARLKIPITFHDINASLSDVESAIHVLRKNGADRLVVLHSTQESGEEEQLYASANIRVMDTYRSAFSGLGVNCGCVEHTSSDFLIYAVAACRPALISKHIQILKHKNDHDPKISVDIGSLRTMVQKVRYVEMAMGMGCNQLMVDSQGRQPLGAIARRKVLVASADIAAGTVIGEDNIAAKRPGRLGGLSPWQFRLLRGAKAKTDIPANTILNLNMFEDFPTVEYQFPGVEVMETSSLDKIQGA